MKGRLLTLALVLVVASLAIAGNARWIEAQQRTALIGDARPVANQAVSLTEGSPVPDADFNSSPVMFIENVGQWDDGALFQVWGGPAGTIWLAEDAIWITVLEAGETSRQVDKGFDPEAPFKDREDPATRRGVNIKLSFVRANPQPRIEAYDRLDTKINYFLGDDPGKWRSEVPVWSGARYVELYPGVNLTLSDENGQLALRLAARPDADLSAVGLRVEGAVVIGVEQGELRLASGAGSLLLPLPQADFSYLIEGETESGQVADWAATLGVHPGRKSLVPADNPTDLLYGTFLGGGGADSSLDIAVDGAGSAYVTSYTYSTNFPTTPGAFDTSHNGSTDAFVAKLNRAGSALAYATFLGGSGRDDGWAIAVDGAGSAYVMGSTGSDDFPTTPGAFDTSRNGLWDVFVAKLNPAGSALAYSTFLGGTSTDYGSAIAVDAAGSAYVTGSTASDDFPTTPGAFDTSRNDSWAWDAFVAKLNPAGSALAHATFLGGNSTDSGTAIAVDGAGSAYVTGITYSDNFPTTPGAFDPSYNGGTDAFVAKLNPAGSALAYATFLGGNSTDYGRDIAVDGAGSTYVTGITYSTNFPTTPGAFDTSYNGGDAFVAKLNPAGSALAYATFLGGNREESGFALAVDEVGSAYVTGSTASNDFPTTLGAFDTSYNGYDAFVAKLMSAGNALAYATFLGSSRDECGYAIAVDGAGSAYVMGTTNSGDFPTTPGAFDPSYNGGTDTFVVKLAMGGSVVSPTPTPTPLPDLSVDHIEVVQVFVEERDPISQTPIPLIAEKDTLVRVYVGLTGAPSVYGVTAHLHMRNAFGIEHTITKSANWWPVTVTQNPDIARLQDTINFRPPPGLLWGNIAFWAEVDPHNNIVESNETNNTGQEVSKPFEPGKTARIAWTTFGYRNPALSNVELPNLEVAAAGADVLRQIFPVGVDDVEYFYQPGATEVLAVKFNGNEAEYLRATNRAWNLISSWGNNSPDRLYAWISGAARDPYTTCGVGDAIWNEGQGRVAVGADTCDKQFEGGPRTISPGEVMVHEMGHMLNSEGLRHTPNDAGGDCIEVPPGPGYYPPATPRGSIIAHGLNIRSSRVLDPESTYDFMSYCKPSWASPYNYQILHGGFEDPPASIVAETHSMLSTRQLMVSGMVYSPTMRIDLDPFYAMFSTAAPSPSIGNDYCLEALTANGSSLASRCFGLGFHHSEYGLDPETSTEVADGFALIIPYPSGTTQIVLTHLGVPIATRMVSPNAPTVRLLSPNGGETWSGTGVHTVRWTAEDQDGDPLHFALAYSIDAGISWIPVGLDLPGTQHALDVSMLPGGTSVLLRVSATDGINTADDVSDAPFTLGSKPPQAFILSPEDGARFFPGAEIWLETYAFDLEDGTLSDTALQWSSNRDGDLGTGKLVITELSPGPHTVTLVATDQDGNTASVSVQIFAGQSLYLPILLRQQ